MLFSLLLDTPLADILHDPLYLTLLGILATLLAGIIGALVTYWIFLKQRIKKEITYRILADAPIASLNQLLANINAQIKDRLQILFDGKPVENLRVLIIKVWNSGNVDVWLLNSKDADVKHEEGDKPIRFEFKGRRVVGIVGLETEPKDDVIDPEDLKAYFTQFSLTSLQLEFIELPHCILKPKQSIELTLLITGNEGEIIRRGKLFNGKIVPYSYKEDDSKIGYTILLIFFVIITLFLSVAAFISIYNYFTHSFLIIGK